MKAADAAADEARRAGTLGARAPPGSRAGAGAGVEDEVGTPAVIRQTEEDEAHVTALKEAVKAAESSGLLSLLQPPPLPGFPPFPPLF